MSCWTRRPSEPSKTILVSAIAVAIPSQLAIKTLELKTRFTLDKGYRVIM